MKDVNLFLCGNLWQSQQLDRPWSRFQQVLLCGASYLGIGRAETTNQLPTCLMIAKECLETLLTCMSCDSSPDEPAITDLRYDC